MAPSRYYSSVARRTTLTGDITNSATTMTVAAATGFPGSVPYTLIVDQDTATLVRMRMRLSRFMGLRLVLRLLVRMIRRL